MATIKTECLSLTAMVSNFREDGITRDAMLQYLIEELGYVSDIRTITEKGMKNGVTYKHKDTDYSQKWPVYDTNVQILLAAKVGDIKLKYGSLCCSSAGSSSGFSSRQPEKIPMDEYPCLEEIYSDSFSSFVAYDFETTGLSPAYDAIIEIGAIRVENGVICENASWTFQELVKPYKQSVSPKITEITGITKDDVANARPIWEVMKDFSDFIGNDIMIGYNSASFDSRFLARAGRISGIKLYNKQFDVMKQAKRTLHYEGPGKSYSLASVSSRLGIKNPNAHRALADAITTAKVFLALKKY